MKDKRIKQLEEIRNEVFDLANSYAGDKTGTVACELHKVSNGISNCFRMLKTGITPQDNKSLFEKWFSDNPDLVATLFH